MPTISGSKQKNVSPLSTPYTMLLCIGLKTDLTAWFSGFTLHNIERGKGGRGRRSFFESLHFCLDDKDETVSVCKSQQLVAVVGAGSRSYLFTFDSGASHIEWVLWHPLEAESPRSSFALLQKSRRNYRSYAYETEALSRVVLVPAQ